MRPNSVKTPSHFSSVLLGLVVCVTGCSKGGADTDPYPTDDLGMTDSRRDGGNGRLDLSSSVDLALPPSEGKPVWGRSYKNQGNNVGGVAVGPDGAVYLTGSFTAADFGDGEVTAQGSFDCFLLKFDKNGQRLWSRTFGRDSVDAPKSIAVDRSGNAVITGFSTNKVTGRGDAFVAYYDSHGNQRYFKPFSIPSASTRLPPAVAAGFAADGGVYFTGFFDDRINFGGGELVSVGFSDIYLVQLSPTGAHVFSKSWGQSAGDSPTALSMMPDGDLLMTATTSGAIDFGDGSKGNPIESAALVRFSPQGVARWSKRWALSANALLVAAAPDGTLWLATDINNTSVDLGGRQHKSPTGYGLLTAHFTGSGAYLDSFLLSSGASSYFTGIAVDSTGQLVAGGFPAGEIDFGFGPTTNNNGKAFYMKQAWTGQVRWARRFGGTASIKVEAIAVSPDNHMLVGGTVDENIMLGTVSLMPHSFVLALTP